MTSMSDSIPWHHCRLSCSTIEYGYATEALPIPSQHASRLIGMVLRAFALSPSVLFLEPSDPILTSLCLCRQYNNTP